MRRSSRKRNWAPGMPATNRSIKPRSPQPASTLITFSRRRRACGMRSSVALRACWHWTRSNSNGFPVFVSEQNELRLTGATPNACTSRTLQKQGSRCPTLRHWSVRVVHGDVRGRIPEDGLDGRSGVSRTLGLVSRIVRPDLGVVRRFQKEQLLRRHRAGRLRAVLERGRDALGNRPGLVRGRGRQGDPSNSHSPASAI